MAVTRNKLRKFVFFIVSKCVLAFLGALKILLVLLYFISYG